MFVYAGIDEAGYGPLLGPLIVGRSVLVVPKLDPDAPTPDLWLRLGKAVCKRVSDRAGRIAVNDSKKLTTKAAGIRHLELGCLAFAGMGDGSDACDPQRAFDLGGWLDLLGETGHRDGGLLPWYAPADASPWQVLPAAVTAGEVAVASGMLRNCAQRIGIGLGDLGAAVVFEDQFNRMVAATHSKASVSFTFVAGHILHVWQTYGQHKPTVVIDRQGGRTHYRELLAQSFPDAQVDVIEESATSSAYTMTDAHDRSMNVTFMVDAEESHMPVALASMVSKYTRELLMARLNAYFTEKVPGLKPTAGYAKDGKRFLDDLAPHLSGLGLDPQQLRRTS
jgi:ribonuclease HII